MIKRELCQLAHDYNPAKHDITGYMVSEKLEGLRCFWDGGITRGLPIEEVPWANLLKSGGGRTATGLWTRYGHPFFAPDWWIDTLPVGLMLDGELWSGRGQFQQIVSTTKTTVNLSSVEAEWRKIKYMVFDVVAPDRFFTVGQINNQNYQMMITPQMLTWYNTRHILCDHPNKWKAYNSTPYVDTCRFMENVLVNQLVEGSVVNLVEQTRLPLRPADASIKLGEWVHWANTTPDCEGLIIRSPDQHWFPKRMVTVLKVKERDDDVAEVVGYRSGAVGKEGNLHGKMGALFVKWRGLVFKLSGFTHEEREWGDADFYRWSLSNPDCDCPAALMGKPFRCRSFPVGSQVKFTYRGVSNDGVPKEAAYSRN